MARKTIEERYDKAKKRVGGSSTKTNQTKRKPKLKVKPKVRKNMLGFTATLRY